MKKILPIILVLILALGLTACGKTDVNSGSGENKTSSTQNESDISDSSETKLDTSDDTTVSNETAGDTQSTTSTPVGNITPSKPSTSSETSKPTVSSTPSETSKPTVSSTPSDTSKPTVSSTPDPVKPSPNDTKNNLYFSDNTLDGRWTVNSISVIPKEAYFENGALVVHCYIVNGYSVNANNVHIKQIIVLDKNNKQIAHAYFNAQNLSIPSLSYVDHTFTFAAETITSTDVDMSNVVLNSQFKTYH